MSISDGVNRIYEKKMDKNEFVDAVVLMVILVKLNMETGAVGKEGFFFSGFSSGEEEIAYNKVKTTNSRLQNSSPWTNR